MTARTPKQFTSPLSRRQFTRNTGVATSALVGASLLPPSTASANAQQPQSGGTLRMALNTGIRSIDPHQAVSNTGDKVRSLVYSQLLKYYHDRELVSDLAESYEMVDSTTYVFHLRPDVMFHDGTPLTAEDVVASYERIIDPGTGSRLYSSLQGIESISAQDELTVEFTLREPQATFLSVLGLPGNSIVQKQKIDAGVDFEQDVVGTGPFVLTEHTVDVETRFERNTDYFVDGLPYLDEVVLRTLEDDAARMNAFYSGDIDVVTFVPWPEMTSLETNDQYRFESNATDGFIMLEFRVDQPPFDNEKLRQAISYGIDREAIINTATFGRGAPCTGGIVPPWMWAHNEDLAGRYAYDPDKARSLIQEAGAEGTEIEFSTNPASDTLLGQPSVLIANQLNQLGLNVTLKTMGIAAWADTRDSGNYQMFADASLYDLPDPDFLSAYYETDGRIPSATRFSDDQIDAWLEEARGLTDQDERREIYNLIEERALELSPIVWLIFREQGDAWQTNVQGYAYLGGQGGANALLETWIEA